jgi:hypothetical protein
MTRKQELRELAGEVGCEMADAMLDRALTVINGYPATTVQRHAITLLLARGLSESVPPQPVGVRRLGVVINTEGVMPMVLGRYLTTDEDTVLYLDAGGRQGQVPEDCVTVQYVEVTS